LGFEVVTNSRFFRIDFACANLMPIGYRTFIIYTYIQAPDITSSTHRPEYKCIYIQLYC